MMLAYHEISDAAKDVYALSPESFRRHAAIVSQNHQEWDSITFDDGHISQFVEAVPILSQFQLRATFFVTTAWIGTRESVANWADVRESLRLGHKVASHTHTHPLLTACDDAALLSELSISKRILEDRLGAEITSISMPGGRVDARVLRACREAGYQRVFTSRVGENRPASDGMPEVFGRYVITRATGEKTLASYLAGESVTMRRLELEGSAKRLVKRLVGDSIYQKVWRKAVRSQFHGA